MNDWQPSRAMGIVGLVLAGLLGGSVAVLSLILLVVYGWEDYGFAVIIFIVLWSVALGLLAITGYRLFKRLPPRP